MANFAPLNIEIESESEDEVDDSKEIQIEEALKLYQNALKLHSQGPDFYKEAEDAYNELFRSEIFTYPESLSEAQRIESYGAVEELEDDSEDDFLPTITATATGVDIAPSSLPQILYLAYKNHGQFQLDRLKARLSRIEHELKPDDQSNPLNSVSGTATFSLKLFVEALDRDDTDLELWRQVARIAGLLGSRRIARFCLESVVDTDEGDFDPWTEPLGLEESFAREQLKPLLRSLDDQLSESQLTAPSYNYRNLTGVLKRNVDPFPYLPPNAVRPSAQSIAYPAKNQNIAVPLRTWASCGKAILFRLSQELQGVLSPDPGAGYLLVIPSNNSTVILPPPARQISSRDTTADNDRPAFVRSPTEDKAEYVDALTEVSNVEGAPEGHEDRPIELSDSIVQQPKGSPMKINQVGHHGRGNGEQVPLLQGRADKDGIAVRPTVSVVLPTRKRSSEAAELPDSPDIGRSRSKRIKARGSIDPNSLKDTTAEDWARWYEQQLQIYHEADEPAFAIVQSLLAKLGSKEVGSLEVIRDIVSNQCIPSGGVINNAEEPLKTAAQDLKTMLDGWDLPKSKAFLSGHDAKDSAGPIGGTQNPGFTAFLEHSTQEPQASPRRPPMPGDYALDDFANELDDRRWRGLHEISYEWIAYLLSPGRLGGQDLSLYEACTWPDSLKEAVVQMLVNEDEAIFSQTNRLAGMMEQQKRDPVGAVELGRSRRSKFSHMQLVQTIYEVHLDVYGRITNPSSEVDAITRLLQRERLCRWAAFSSKLLNQRSSTPKDDGQSLSDLEVRFMWSSVVCTSLLEPASRDHTVLCFQDLIRILGKERLKSGVELTIDLPNNAIMPEISAEAAEKEISRLTTLDFFMGIFSSENNDPLTIIESLEPLLDLSVQQVKAMNDNNSQRSNDANSIPLGEQSEFVTNPKLLEALRFLNRGSLPLRLFLWQRLRTAYQAIHYPPQILCCNLRSFALITDHLTSSSYADGCLENRHDSLLRWLNKLDDFLTRILAAALFHKDAFETLDVDHVRVSLEALARLRDVLHVFALWEDTIRVGKTQVPISVGQTAHRGLSKSTDKFRDMIVRTWTLQYLLLKEAVNQSPELFTDSDEMLLHYLKRVHQTLGLRCYCSLADKIFLKLMKNELEKFKLAEGWDTDMAQLVFDLYGLKISSTTVEMQDHGCLPEELDRRTALEVMDTVMLHVNRLSIKDLLKSDLKFAVDKMQQVIKIPKVTTNATARTFNYRLANNYLKSPINPVDLYRSLRGVGGLCGNPARSEGSEIAAKGWYFLLGHIGLAKFRSQKRSAMGSTDDLEIARTFFRHDLEFDTEKWETWYRLGQVYDAMIEEDSLWTADKLDNHMAELAVLQRKAIHCYAMAMAVGIRCGDASFEATSKMADLCADFGTRIYASTREPFSMRAFNMDEFKRPFNRAGQGMYDNHQFPGLTLYSAWKFASFLLRRASIQRPQDWVLSYMLGKVLWKMHKYGDNVLHNAKHVGYQAVINAFVRAIKSCPDKRDSRHPDKDPILEPHYKLVSVVYKLRLSSRISVEEGCRILKATPYSRKVPDIHDGEDWSSYILQVIKALRSADKANWHHRMVARAAHIIYKNNMNEAQAALDAKHEITQQIFTKTMAIQVWKPDNERAGRHFVYTGRYVRFFVRLLYQLNDKSSLEALARRIRKKAGDFVGHAAIWQELCQAYLKLLRKQPHCKIPDRYQEDVFTGMNPETFQLNASRLEASIHSATTNSPILEILREAIEFKKLNNNYFKSGSFEELIGDIYAHLYDTFLPEINAKETAEENRVRMRLDNILAAPGNAAETPPPDQAGEQGSERRTKANRVTPREIIRKAEAIAARPAPTVPAKALKTLAPAPALEQGRPGLSSPVVTVVIHEDPVRDPGSSVPGSVHDSADDESELSEVDEELPEDTPANVVEDRPHMFPNLDKVGTNESAGADNGFVTANETQDDEEDDDDEDMRARREHAAVEGRGRSEEQEPQQEGDAMEL